LILYNVREISLTTPSRNRYEKIATKLIRQITHVVRIRYCNRTIEILLLFEYFDSRVGIVAGRNQTNPTFS